MAQRGWKGFAVGQPFEVPLVVLFGFKGFFLLKPTFWEANACKIQTPPLKVSRKALEVKNQPKGNQVVHCWWVSDPNARTLQSYLQEIGTCNPRGGPANITCFRGHPWWIWAAAQWFTAAHILHFWFEKKFGMNWSCCVDSCRVSLVSSGLQLNIPSWKNTQTWNKSGRLTRWHSVILSPHPSFGDILYNAS